MPTKTTSRKPLLLALVLLVALGALGGVGWRWLSGVTVSEVAVAGAEHAVPDSLVALAGVAVGDTLVHVDPVIAADRVRRHPWVETANVRRLPTGTVLITVDERTPVALALERGRPSHYLDRHGYGMPRVEGAAYDVPVLRGLGDAYHPVTPVQDSLALGVLDALARVDPETNGLVSDVELRGGEAWVYTVPAGARGSIPVRLGSDDVAAKLRRLKAFWTQAVLPQPATRFQQIDLRFASQVITRETAPTTPTSTD